MTKAKTYTNATSFRRALEDRLNSISKKEGIDIQTLRRHVAFDQLLARLFRSQVGVPWALKGGYAMELRTESARTTKDIDLAMRDQKLFSQDSATQNDAIREELQKFAVHDLGDFFVYLIGAPTMDLDAAPYGGGRFPVQVNMDQRLFINFHLDVGVGDVWIEPLEKVDTGDWLVFAGIGASTVLAISKEQQFAEKLHAYTLPRGDRQNSRVKDLVDLALLVRSKALNEKRLLAAIKATFERRKTHDVPDALEPPPAEWQRPFSVLSEECGLTLSIELAFSMLASTFKNLDT